MDRSTEFDEVLRRKIGELLGEPLDENASADDLMFDLGMRYLRSAAAEKRKKADSRGKQLSLWVDGSASKKALIDYVDTVTNKNGPDYIPQSDRIAVFDLDGTLYCESDPTWFDFMLFKYRIQEDPAYREKATEYEKQVADTVQSVIDTGLVPDGFEVEMRNCIARAFAGMKVSDFADYVRDYAERPSPGYDGMKIGEAFYLPMVQVIDYLQDNGFTVYVCSGSDRLVVRGLVEGGLILAARYVIGTEELISASNQGNRKGTDYVFSGEDDLVLTGRIAVKNLKMTKVSMVTQQIGQCPVMSFGNSTGDVSITNYVMSNSQYKTAAFFVVCDDEIRESGTPEKAQKIRDLCVENNWIPISMKDDWLTVFGDGVTKKTPVAP